MTTATKVKKTGTKKPAIAHAAPRHSDYYANLRKRIGAPARLVGKLIMFPDYQIVLYPAEEMARDNSTSNTSPHSTQINYISADLHNNNVVELPVATSMLVLQCHGYQGYALIFEFLANGMHGFVKLPYWLVMDRRDASK